MVSDNSLHHINNAGSAAAAPAVALFVGSFDPFTIGHADVARRALAVFPRLVIGVSVNPEKRYMLTAAERVKAIADCFAGDARVTVVENTGLTVDLARRVGARCIVKGVRSVADFEYERTEAEVNRRLTGIETLLLLADPKYASVSSTVYRQLAHFGQDASWMLPATARPADAVQEHS